MRASAGALTGGETRAKAFFGLEKKHASLKHIETIESDGVIVTDSKDIERAFDHHFENLFAFRREKMSRFKELFLSRTPRRYEEVKASLEEPISQKEVSYAIDSLNLRKSPGSGGLCTAWYKTFNNYLSPVLTALYNEAYELKTLPPSFGCSHTILIPKTKEKRETEASIILYRLDLFQFVYAYMLEYAYVYMYNAHTLCVRTCFP